MLPRTMRRRLESTLLPYSRQSLPRPARLYSAPSKTNNAPASALAIQTSTNYPHFMPKVAKRRPEVFPQSNDMTSFLSRQIPYTILPTPLPDDRSSPSNEAYWIRSPTQDLLSVMDACLRNLYDVPRAKQVFERLRKSDLATTLLDVRQYNAFLSAYLEMATTKDVDNKAMWLEDAWALFNIIERGTEKVVPNPGTYSVMLLAWLRFNPESHPTLEIPTRRDPATLLTNIHAREIPVSSVISDRVFSSSEDAAEVIRILSKTAVELNLPQIVNELGQAEAIGRFYVDPLEDVPEILPVTRIKTPLEISSLEATSEDAPDGESAMSRREDWVPFNLSNLRKHLAQVALARRVLPEDVASRQKLLEESVFDVAVERWKHDAEVLASIGLGSSGLKHADLQAWMWHWHQKLKKQLGREIQDVIGHENELPRATIRLGPFLSLVTPEKLSLITILEIMRLHGSGGIADGMKTTRALLSVGRAVEVEYKADMCKKNRIHFPTHPRVGDHGYFSRFGYAALYASRMAARTHVDNEQEWTSEWTQSLRIRVGSILVNCLMDVATVTRTGVDKRTNEPISEEQPAFFHGYEYVRGQKLGVIKLNPQVSERLAKDGVRETLHPRHLPMLIKPKPWISHDQGGYLYNRSLAMRYKDCQEQMIYLKQACALGNVELVYAGLDVLGSTPWKINRQVFDVVLKVWNSGVRFCKIPPATYDEPEPTKPENYDSDIRARTVYGVRQKAYVQNRSGNHSERCSVNYKIEIARAFLGDTMYLPHNLDFRGRAYPIPPHLNHIGDDLSRGLLVFGEAKPLGERGLRWLKIHLANLAGFDKGSFDERVAFVHKHLDQIYDSAERPLEGNRWWTEADDPWQCLATCMELRAALESCDPQSYLSCLPVHQDGTCNGLQHYAALGGDDKGARQVNLSVTDRPSDVYTHVAEMVEEKLASDMKQGDKFATMLSGKVSRKVVKQTVMTTVYGVTYIGARSQIEGQLKDLKEIPQEECWGAASYLAKLTLACIGDLFKGAKSIQVWLNLCARLIAKSMPAERIPDALEPHLRQRMRKDQSKAFSPNRIAKEQMTSVVWTTPLGLPIVQPYRKTKRSQIMTALQTVYLSDPNSPAEVNSMKQASAFPPNFIHSLDATHMMLTALECKTQGLTFASVHDSYWTHACDVDKMSTIIRDTFVALHSSNVLQKLQTEFQERYKGFKVPMVLLKIPGLMKQLRNAGCTWDLLPQSSHAVAQDDNSEGTTEDTRDDEAHDETPAVKTRAKRRTKKQILADEALLQDTRDDDADDEAHDETPAVKPRAKRRTKKQILADEALLQDRFIDLVDLLPPLPKKGDFKVETIKKSQYFFS